MRHGPQGACAALPFRAVLCGFATGGVQVAEPAGLASQNADAATRESLLESFGDRRVVREHLLQQALRERQWCPDRPIAKAKHPQKGRDMEYYVLLRSRLTDAKRIKDGLGLEIEVLP